MLRLVLYCTVCGKAPHTKTQRKELLLLLTEESCKLAGSTHQHTHTHKVLIVPEVPGELESNRAECPGAVRKGDYKAELKFSGAEPQLEEFG